jgi:uncharacterized protein (TIGR02453 family)
MFPGFPPEAMTFFRGLARNNTREWYQPRKEIYEEKLKAPMLTLVEALNRELAKFGPGYVTEPKKAVYRIYRDTRFSTDKTPYKTHIAALFASKGSDKHSGTGLYFGVSLEGTQVAGGVYMPQPEQLLALRTWFSANHEKFRKAARGPEKLMGKIQGSALQRIPKGFDAEHPAADLIKMKQWIYGALLPPDIATSPKLFSELVKRFRVMVPVLEMLNEAMPRSKRAAGAYFD